MNTRLFLCATVALLALSACGGGVRPGLDVNAERERAANLAASGQLRNAARVLEQAARASDGEVADALWVDTAHAWYRAGDNRRATRSLEQHEGDLPAGANPMSDLIVALGLYDSGRNQASQARLNAIPTPYPELLAPGILALEGQLAFRDDRPAAGVAALVERDLWLREPTDIETNQRRIWDELLRARATGASLDVPADAGDTVSGWLALADAADWESADPFALKSAVLGWEAEYPGHPASRSVLPAILARYRALARTPQRIAVVLPLSGRLGAAGTAVRDGLLAAHFDLATRPDSDAGQIVFYDSAASGVDIAYQTAVGDAADFIIGPLAKPDVAAVASLPRRVPTLALNNLADPSLGGGGLYQFALASEDEAVMAAERAIADGHRRAVAFVPTGSWGSRMAMHFSETFEAAGGVVLGVTPYNPRSPDFSSEIRTALHLSESDARQRELARVIGERLEFEPRRRGDVDVLFMAAQAEPARLMRPQLRFHYAADLPLYTTSSSFEPGSDENGELNGMLFPDIPWVVSDQGPQDALKRALVQYWPDDGERRLRLFALGHDAYRLVPRLYADGGSIEMDGLSGRLLLDPADGVVRRELDFMTVRRGRPETLPPPSHLLPGPLPETDAGR